MPAIPSMPGWDALHPALVHFPIALLIVAPLFIVIGIALRKSTPNRPYMLAALILMSLGTISTFLATSTGEAAKQAAKEQPAIQGILAEHEELAETTQVGFTALTLIYAAILFGPQLFRRPLHPGLQTALPIAFLVLYSAGLMLLINTAHQGGLLVHGTGAADQASAAVGPAPTH